MNKRGNAREIKIDGVVEYVCFGCGVILASFEFKNFTGSFVFCSNVECRNCGSENNMFTEFNGGHWPNDAM